MVKMLCLISMMMSTGSIVDSYDICVHINEDQFIISLILKINLVYSV